ncbi:hypothetical protein SEA_BIG4_224 [Microbacterium phage Big4]|nr:hypothetical protein SEA_BIG4_224 [Microbacterium phage Big4]
MTYAVYYEMSDGDKVNQYIFAPASKLENVTLVPVLWYRELTKATPNRGFTRIARDDYKPLAGEADIDTLLSHEMGQFEGLSTYMRGPLADPSYEVQVVFPVLLTDSIKYDILQNNTNGRNQVPVDLLAQIRVQRSEYNLPKLPGES